MFKETWNNGQGTLESNCSVQNIYQVHNIEQINFNSIGLRFSVHHDHRYNKSIFIKLQILIIIDFIILLMGSKWAVTTNKNFRNEKFLGII